MRNLILRILVFVILLSLIVGIVISVIGYMLGWETPIQYSNAFFWAGLIFISLGFISFQGYRYPARNWPPDFLRPNERTHLLDADILRGRNIMVFLGGCGLLMFGFAILIMKLF